MNLIFDLETNGLLSEVDTVHCLAIKDIDTNEVFVFNDQGGDRETITTGITSMLMNADTVIGHNIINYDIPVLKKLYPFFESPTAIDTLVLSRMYHGDMLQLDRRRQWPRMPLQLYGRHSLESYGYRLGEYKGEFGKGTDWKQWSQEMESYCEQDLAVTHKLWDHFAKKFKTVHEII